MTVCLLLKHKLMTTVSRPSRKKVRNVILMVLMFILFTRMFQNSSTIKAQRQSDNPSKHLHNDSNIALVLEAALAMKERQVLVTVVNDGYYDMVYSWICHTKHMGFHKQVLIITTRRDGAEKMTELSPDIHVVVIDVEESMHGHQEYSHVGYLKIMVLRTAIQYALLQNNIEMFAFECDAVFFKNPIPVMEFNSGMYDVLFTSNYKNPKAVNGGFIYMFPTTATKETFKQLNRQMQALYKQIKTYPSDRRMPTSHNDQEYLSKLVREKCANLKSAVFPFETFPDGNWYELTKEERWKTDPVIIHNNWIRGNQEKIDRLKKWGHWFLKSDKSCNIDNIKRFISNTLHRTI